MFTDDEIRQLTQKHWSQLDQHGASFADCQAGYFAAAMKATLVEGGDLEKSRHRYALFLGPMMGYVSATPFFADWCRNDCNRFEYIADAFDAAYSCALGEIMGRKKAAIPVLT